MKTNKKLILDNEDFFSKGLVIGVTIDDIMAEFNAYDWLDLQTTPLEFMAEDFKKRLKFKSTESIWLKAFAHKFEQAVKNLSALVEEVNDSYNIPGKGGVTNPHINNYYYLKLWADKKAIPLNYNELDYNKRKLFNFYTILFDIFADKLSNFNAYNAQKS